MIEDSITFDYSALEGKIKEKYDTQDNFAKAIPMGRSTLNQKLQNKVDFTASNIYTISKLLGIDSLDIGKYFFTKKVWKSKHNKEKEE